MDSDKGNFRSLRLLQLCNILSSWANVFSSGPKRFCTMQEKGHRKSSVFVVKVNKVTWEWWLLLLHSRWPLKSWPTRVHLSGLALIIWRGCLIYLRSPRERYCYDFSEMAVSSGVLFKHEKKKQQVLDVLCGHCMYLYIIYIELVQCTRSQACCILCLQSARV